MQDKSNKSSSSAQKRASLIIVVQRMTYLIVAFTAICMIALMGFEKHRDLQNNAERMRSSYTETQRASVKREVERVVDMVQQRRTMSDDEATDLARARVYRAYSIAENIYSTYRESKSPDEILELILSVLAPIRFDDGHGYYFVNRMDGVVLLVADRPDIQGRHYSSLSTPDDQNVVKSVISVAKQQDEGSLQYSWSVPGGELNEQAKITYVKQFKPLNILIGTGLYRSDIQNRIQQDLLEEISQIRYGNNGYFFVNTLQGDVIAHGEQPRMVGTSIWAYVDNHGNEVFQELLKAVNNPEGSFAFYWWRMPETGLERPKLAYAKSVPEWNWLIGTGLYLDEVEADIAKFEAELLNSSIKEFSIALVVIVILAVITYLLLRILFKALRKDLQFLKASFIDAASHESRIDEVKVQFQEFANLAESANKMLKGKAAARQKVEQLAYYDQLTGLPNRRLFIKQLKSKVAHAQQTKTITALLFIDLDDFKELNDSYGHLVGDELLKLTAERFNQVVGEHGTLARIGGDEFTVFLPGFKDVYSASTYAAELGQEIIHSLTNDFVIKNISHEISASVGIALYPQHGTTLDELLMHADSAMYQAKAQGRSRVNFFSKELYQAQQQRGQLIRDMAEALQNRDFFLCYQPIASLQNGRINSCEALIRWRHKEQGLIPPDEFIPLAEETGQINQIGLWVLDTAISQLRSWHEKGFAGFHMAINLSVKQLKQPAFPNTLIQLVEQYQVPPELVTLEVTETVMLSDTKIVSEALQKIKKMGFKISLDDFGTGYSSMNYVKYFPVDALKIDQSFVRDMLNSEEDKAIITSTMALTHSLGILTVAEGVETEEQKSFLAAEGCTFMQGYLLAKPMPAEEFETFLKQHHMN